MAISVDYSTSPFRITVPQSDLTLVSGSLYTYDTGTFWEALKTWEASETGIVFNDMQSHNAEYTVAGETYARKIEILNSTNSTQNHEFEVFFSPDTQYSIKLTGSNNNIFDIQNGILANSVTQIIPTNSAGLIQSAALSDTELTMLTELYRLFGLDSLNPVTRTPTSTSWASETIEHTGDPDSSITSTRI